MEIINRVKNILVTPKPEWETIDSENDKSITVLTKYVLLLAAIPAVASFIGHGFFSSIILWGGGFGYAFKQAIVQYIVMVGGVYISAFVIDLLAPNFGSQKNFDKAFSLVAYAYTPAFVGGIFYIFLPLGFFAGLAALYSLYLLYLGLTPMMKTPNENHTTYFVVSLLVMIAAFFFLSVILHALLIGSMLAF